MNRPPEQFVRIDETALGQLACNCLCAAGLRADHADQMAQLLVGADLRGVRSHGARQIVGYCRHLRDGTVNPTPRIRVISESPAAALVDGDGGLGYVPMLRATDLAIERALEMGVGVGAARHMGHYGAAGHYVRRALEAGCVAFSVQGHGSAMGEPHPDPQQRPPVAYWGNPPMCFGLPGDEEPALVLDMATCILGDAQRGEAFDQLQEQIPAAFHKSMGFTGVARALGGIFVGLDGAEAAAVRQRWVRARGGGLIVIMKSDLFAPAGEVRAGMDRLVRGVRETMRPMVGQQEALLPGTPEARCEVEYRRDGIPVGLADAEAIGETALELGVPLPDAFSDRQPE